MGTTLRVLIIEDSKDDAFFIVRELRKGGYSPEYQVVDTAENLRVALIKEQWDLIISDYRMQDFNGLDALDLYRKADLDIPFILVSGTIGEEVAVIAMRSGAHDYLMKDNLTRLVPAVQRELKEAESRKARRKAEHALRSSERKYRHLFQNAPSGIFEFDFTQDRFISVNEVMCNYTGYAHDEFLRLPPADLIPSNTAFLNRQRRMLDQGLHSDSAEYRVNRKDGSGFWALFTSRLTQEGNSVISTTVVHDITKRKETENELRRYSERLKILRDLDLAILQAESPRTIAEAAFDHIRQLIPCVHSNVIEFDYDNNVFHILASSSKDSSIFTQGMKLPLDLIANLVERLRQGELHVVDDIDSPPSPDDLDAPLKSEGVLSYISLPLIVQGELIGALTIGADQKGIFSDEHIDMVYDIANLLAVAIQQAQLFKRVHDYAVDLELRVAERTEDLQLANERLEALSRVKDEFVSNVSHELRTPISNIKVQKDLFEKNKDDAGTYLDIMHREIERLEYLVEDLLSLSRLDQDGYPWNPVEFELDRLCEEYALDRIMLAANRNIRLRFDPSPDKCIVQADYHLLGQLIGILLNNAIQYIQPGGEISIQTHTSGEDAITWNGFSVDDNGPGIPEEEQARVFERFYRGSAGRQSDVPGTGLGLAIAREIVDRHAGRIEIISPHKNNRGTRIEVWIPREIMESNPDP